MNKFIFKLKKLLPLAVIVALFTSTATYDDCTAFFPMDEGQTFEITHYDKKDKIVSRTEYEVIGKILIDNGISSTIKMKSYDKKDKDLMDSEFNVSCEGGIFKVDIRSLMSGAQLQQMSSMNNMDVSVETDDLEIPSNLSVGDKLDDGSLRMEVNTEGGAMTMMSMTTNVTNRKVVGQEKMTTPAGTFDCYVITSDVQSKMSFMNFQLSTKDWIAKDVGLVKSESYRKGKLEGYSLLTKFN